MSEFEEIKYKVPLKVDKKEDQWTLKQKWSIITVCIIQSNSYNVYNYTMLFVNKDENGELYKHFFKNIWYEIYNTDNALIMKMADDFNNSEIKVIKMICKLKQAKARKDDWGLFLNSDVVKQKFKELRKLIQKKRKPKESGKAIQSIKENNDAKTKLIKKLKKEAHRVIKKVMTIKSINKEDKLNNNNDLKNSAPTSKNSKNKLGFTKPVIPTQSFSHIQA